MSEPVIPRYDHLPPRPSVPGDPRRRRSSKRDLADRVDPLKRSLFRRLWVAVSWRIGARHLHFFCVQIQSYIEAGMPIAEGFRLMSRSSDHLRIRATCRKIHADLVKGDPLRVALAHHTKTLPRFFTMMLTAAERAGSYGPTLRALQRHYSWLMEMKGEIIRAITYPLCVLLLAKAIFVITAFILIGINANSGQFGFPPNAAVTLSLLLARQYVPVLIAAIAAYWFCVIIAESRQVRAVIDRIGLVLPIFGPIIRRYSVANFCRMYGTLIDSGNHPLTAYRDAAMSMGNIALERKILSWERFVIDGEPVSEALHRSRAMPRDVMSVFQTAEDAASGDTVLPRMADFMTDQIRSEMRAIVRALIPLGPFIILLAIGTAIFGSILSVVLSLPSIFQPINAFFFALFFLIFLL